MTGEDSFKGIIQKVVSGEIEVYHSETKTNPVPYDFQKAAEALGWVQYDIECNWCDYTHCYEIEGSDLALVFSGCFFYGGYHVYTTKKSNI